jgi:uncharacterized membrane protein YvbJ
LSNCPKCGSQIDENMAFCPKCGASLKAEKPADSREQWREQRRQWKEQRREMRHQYWQDEWGEKYEKHEYRFVGPLIGGLVLIAVGFLFYLAATTSLNLQIAEAIFLILIGFVILTGAIYAYTMRRRHRA